MSQLFIIAGTPGVGKTTVGHRFIPPNLDIINEDEMRFKYRERGYPDYKEQAIHRVTQAIRNKLISNEDFAFELNLGYEEHYEYVISAKQFSAENSLNVILFHSDDLDLCLNRARLRHESGRHLVKPETIRTMYANTLPLLKANFGAIDLLTLVNVEADAISAIAVYDKKANKLVIREHPAKWFNNDLYPFIVQPGLNVSKDESLGMGF